MIDTVTNLNLEYLRNIIEWHFVDIKERIIKNTEIYQPITF